MYAAAIGLCIRIISKLINNGEITSTQRWKRNPRGRRGSKESPIDQIREEGPLSFSHSLFRNPLFLLPSHLPANLFLWWYIFEYSTKISLDRQASPLLVINLPDLGTCSQEHRIYFFMTIHKKWAKERCEWSSTDVDSVPSEENIERVMRLRPHLIPFFPNHVCAKSLKVWKYNYEPRVQHEG